MLETRLLPITLLATDLPPPELQLDADVRHSPELNRTTVIRSQLVGQSVEFGHGDVGSRVYIIDMIMRSVLGLDPTILSFTCTQHA